MDIKLEGNMNGIEAAGQIRLFYDILVIYLTAYSDEYTVQHAKISEPSGYIIKETTGLVNKPFEESELHLTCSFMQFSKTSTMQRYYPILKGAFN